MRRVKQRAEVPTPSEPVREEVEEDNTDEKNGFFACYLLCSLCPRYKGHTYIGFTVNPRRRIRQHNGEIRCGAWRTKHKRPWEMILCIYGFPSNVSALQFEWAWQHPKESLAVRKAAASFRSLSGIENKIKLAYTMLTLPQWERLNLTVNFFSTKYVKHSAHCPKLPKHMRINVQAMDELPCYTDNNLSDDDDDGDDDGDNKSDRDKDELPHYKGVEISNDDTSTYENSCQRGGELHDSLYGERGNNDFTLYDSYGYIRHSKLMDEAKRTTDCRTPQSNGISHGDDVLRQDGDNLKQHVDPQDSSHLIVSPMHSTKEKPATSNNINLFSCSKELFECVNSCNLVQLKELSTPRTVKYGLSYDSASVSSECNIIDLSTPFIPCSRKRQQSSICVEIIDLIDSPI